MERINHVERKATKVAIIGLDGVYWELMYKAFEQGSMPHLRSLLGRAFVAKLRTVNPPYTPSAWTTIASGVYPSEHGMYGFIRVQVSGDQFKTSLATALDVKAPRIWEILAIEKMHSIIINVPFTFPFKAMLLTKKSLVIPGWETPKIIPYPKSVFKETKWIIASQYLLSMLARIKNAIDNNSTASIDREIYDVVIKTLANKVDELIQLLNTNDWKLFFVILSELDWFMHIDVNMHLRSSLGKYHKLFSLIDKLIKHAINEADYVIICSDHGFKLYNNVLFVNALLYRLGILAPRASSKKRDYIGKLAAKILNTVLQNFISKILDGEVPEKVLRSFTKAHLVKDIMCLDLDMQRSLAISPESYLIYVKRKHERLVLNALNAFVRLAKKMHISIKEIPSSSQTMRTYVMTPLGETMPLSTLSLEKVIERRAMANHSIHGIFAILSKDTVLGKGLPNNPQAISNTVEAADVATTALVLLLSKIPSHVNGSPVPCLDPAYRELIIKSRRYNYLSKWHLLRSLRLRSGKHLIG